MPYLTLESFFIRREIDLDAAFPFITPFEAALSILDTRDFKTVLASSSFFEETSFSKAFFRVLSSVFADMFLVCLFLAFLISL